jgi:proteasome lid subunit RPN8/RPN11
VDIPEQALREIFVHAEEGYPEEVCGIVIGKPGDPKASVVRRCANLANQYHLEDNVRYPRDAKTAYVMDPRGVLRIQTEADEKGLEVIFMYHSHTDHEAYFSKTDREMALFDGRPLWPGTRYLVVSVRDGKVGYFKVFMWDSLKQDFVEVEARILRV